MLSFVMPSPYIPSNPELKTFFFPVIEFLTSISLCLVFRYQMYFYCIAVREFSLYLFLCDSGAQAS